MNATRSWTAEHELLHWLLVIFTAIVLILAVARVLGGLESMPEPRLLPDDIGALAKPMNPEIAKPFFPESPPVPELPPAEAAAHLWTVLEHHRAGRSLEAINAWVNMGLPSETAHWREIALGAAYLDLGDLERAAVRMDAAQQLMPDHALVHYFTGLLRLEQAAEAGRVPDDQRRGDLLVGYTPGEHRAVFRLVAMAELDAALLRAQEVSLDEPLVAEEFPEDEEVCGPTAGELLRALGADNFVGKAHHVLFGLRLDHGELIAAERHLDRAAETGIAVLNGYRDLGEAYLVAGEHDAAIRLGIRDLDLNHPEITRIFGWLLAAEQPRGCFVW